MTDDRLLKERMDGAHAAALLSDELLKGAFETVRQAYAKKLLNTAVDRATDREMLYLAYRTVNEVEQHIRSVVDSGKLADAQLNHLIMAAEAKPRWDQV